MTAHVRYLIAPCWRNQFRNPARTLPQIQMPISVTNWPIKISMNAIHFATTVHVLMTAQINFIRIWTTAHVEPIAQVFY